MPGQLERREQLLDAEAHDDEGVEDGLDGVALSVATTIQPV
jgi:hypothetical protein